MTDRVINEQDKTITLVLYNYIKRFVIYSANFKHHSIGMRFLVCGSKKTSFVDCFKA